MKTWMYWAIGLLVVAGIGIWLYRKKKAESNTEKVSAAGEALTAAAAQ